MVLLQGIKPRLMAHENRQEYGLDYENLFVSIAKIAIVSIFYGYYCLERMINLIYNVKNAFRYEDLKGEIYMTPSPSKLTHFSTEVYHLKQHLYGLKKASFAWFEKFCSTTLDFNFIQNQFNSSLFL
jgi:hypothetical protein